MEKRKTSENAYVWGTKTATRCAWVLAGATGIALVFSQKELALEFSRWQALMGFGAAALLAVPNVLEWVEERKKTFPTRV